MEKIITYFQQPAKVKCDEQCHKAFGSVRPRIYAELPNAIFGHGYSIRLFPETPLNDYDDFVLLADDEIGDAPIDNGCYEGGHAKPVNNKNEPLRDIIPNKWCVRECERCVMSELGKENQPLELKDFSKRIYNIPQ